MTMLRPLYARRMEGRVRLSRGSGDSQTAQWQASVGTPIEVPEPKTVNWRAGISKWRAGVMFDSSPQVLNLLRFLGTNPRRDLLNLLLALGFLGHGVGRGFRDLHKRQLQTSQNFEQELIVFFRQIPPGFFAQSIEHIDYFSCAFEITEGLPAPRVGHSA